MADSTVKKATRAQILSVVKEIIPADFSAEVDDVVVTAEDIVGYCNTTLEQLAAKAAKSKEAAAAKKQAGDELREKIEGLLTSEPQTADMLADAVGDGVTRAQVIARMKSLVDLGRAIKTSIKTEVGTGKATAYTIAE